MQAGEIVNLHIYRTSLMILLLESLCTSRPWQACNRFVIGGIFLFKSSRKAWPGTCWPVWQGVLKWRQQEWAGGWDSESEDIGRDDAELLKADTALQMIFFRSAAPGSGATPWSFTGSGHSNPQKPGQPSRCIFGWGAAYMWTLQLSSTKSSISTLNSKKIRKYAGSSHCKSELAVVYLV